MPADTNYIPVGAVVRLDLFSIRDQPELSVKVVEVLPDYESAAAESAHLNQLNQGKGCIYLPQGTRWYPNGRQVVDRSHDGQGQQD